MPISTGRQTQRVTWHGTVVEHVGVTGHQVERVLLHIVDKVAVSLNPLDRNGQRSRRTGGLGRDPVSELDVIEVVGLVATRVAVPGVDRELVVVRGRVKITIHLAREIDPKVLPARLGRKALRHNKFSWVPGLLEPEPDHLARDGGVDVHRYLEMILIKQTDLTATCHGSDYTGISRRTVGLGHTQRLVTGRRRGRNFVTDRFGIEILILAL